MLYWSMLVYRFEEAVDNKGVTLEGGMKLYGLEHFQLMHERVLDTKALMAWNHHTVVLSFRGTASFKNVLAGAPPPFAPRFLLDALGNGCQKRNNPSGLRSTAPRQPGVSKRTVGVVGGGLTGVGAARADLRAWYAAHPPLRGRPSMGTRPYVHQARSLPRMLPLDRDVAVTALPACE